jgi:hypothetical protein
MLPLPKIGPVLENWIAVKPPVAQVRVRICDVDELSTSVLLTATNIGVDAL